MILRSSVRREPDLRQIATIDLALEMGFVRRASAYSLRSAEGLVDDCVAVDWITGSYGLSSSSLSIV